MKWIKKLLLLFLVVSLTACGTSTPQNNNDNFQNNGDSQDVNDDIAVDNITDPSIDANLSQEELNDAQKNSIAMLNYLACLSQEVNSSKNSRLFLEEAYASLINNTNPEKVNELTESHMSSLLDIIEKYRMVNIKRERLQYLYDQNKAKAIQQAMPNPVALLSLTNARNLKSLAASAIYMAIDSVNSYNTYNDELDQEFLQDGWALDDEESANLHESRKRAFTFMIQIVREEELPGDLALSEKAIEDFVSCKNNTNNTQRIQFLESQRETYKAFGSYWLLLSDCYYQNKEYAKCLQAIDKYETLQADIFRKDYYLAQALPNAIVAASEVYSINEYVPIAEKYLSILLENAENSEWSLRTFAAQIYMDLYAQTNKTDYLEKAYDITLNNVNYLVKEQLELNKTYLNDLVELKVPDNATKEEKKQIKGYNKELKENRKTELPTVYEPLKVNCDILFTLADKLNKSGKDKNKIENILYDNGNDAFITEPVKQVYSFKNEKINASGTFDKDEFSIPVSLVSSTSYIKVTVKNDNKIDVFDDWTVDEVNRETNEFSTFEVTYTSKNLKKYEWNSNNVVTIEVFEVKESSNDPIVLKFKANEKKTLGILKTIEFEQVK